MNNSLINQSNIDRVLSMKSTVLALYPELAGLYRNTQGCTKCKKKSRGSAILLYILNDSNLAGKNKKALKQLLPGSFVDKIGSE